MVTVISFLGNIKSLLINIYKGTVAAGQAKKVTGTHQETTVDNVVDMVTNAKSVIIVPGYGLAVAK